MGSGEFHTKVEVELVAVSTAAGAVAVLTLYPFVSSFWVDWPVSLAAYTAVNQSLRQHMRRQRSRRSHPSRRGA